MESSSKQQSRATQWLYGSTNWALFGAGIVNLVVGTWSAAQSNAAIATTSLTAGLVLLFAASIDRFDSLKGWGIEAKTRRLEGKIDEADEALRRLRELAELTSSALIEMNSKIGRWDSAPTPADAHRLAERVRAIMAGLGSQGPVIAAALRPWAATLCFDLASALLRPLMKAVLGRIAELRAQISAMQQPLNPADPELLRLAEQVRAGDAYVARLREVSRLELDDYPDRLLALIAEAPLLDPNVVAQFRDDAVRFADDMVTLQATMTLPHPHAWFDVLRAHSEKEREGG